ncbi:MAG: DUF47 domain-containing protein [Saprospiraceae bacterium]|nr:DUF47 domain-containing protein [Saprospiraceae bacterium]
MGLNNFLRLFLPKDKIFYEVFENIVINLQEMIHELKTALDEPDKDIRFKMLANIETGEHKNDEYTHQIFVELSKNFITPFDREDIHYLATSLDDIADYMYASTKKMLTYNVEHTDEYMKELVNISEKSIVALADAVNKLRSMKNISQIRHDCVLINSLENKADDVLDSAILNLFAKNTDAIQIIKLKDIYQDLEVISDKCEDASNVIESIIIKYA